MIEALLVVGLSFFNPQVPADSLGTETVDGKVVVVHQVDDKETLYGLARRYGTTVDAIIQFNPLAKDGLSIGQVLKIPYSKKPVVAATSGGVHKVAEKETLYSISRMYNVSIDDIKEWNHLTSNSLSLGQELVIKKTSTQPSITTITPANVETTTQKGVHQVEQKETLFSISRQYNISVDDRSIIERELFDFTSTWSAHGIALQSSFTILENRFVVLGVNEQVNDASGCSIDMSTNVMKGIFKLTGIDFFNRTLVPFEIKGEIIQFRLDQLKQKLKEGMWNEDSVTFNTLADSVGALRENWRLKASESWISRYIERPNFDSIKG